MSPRFAFVLALALPTFFAANASAQECESDADCSAEEYCSYDTPCARPPCDPDGDEPCEFVCYGTCTSGSPWMPSDEECSSDADCGVGMICVTDSWGDCDAGPPCLPDEDCPRAPDCRAGYSYCTIDASPCESDADCAGGLRCAEYTYTECWGSDSSGSGSSGSDAPTPMPEPDRKEDGCAEVTEAYCVPPFMLPCDVDADCDDNYSCQTEEICGCSGGGFDSSDPSEGRDESPDRRKDDDCECFETEYAFCTPDEITCEANGDCPTDWECRDMGGDGVCWFDAESGEEGCEVSESEMYCVPGGYDDWVGGGHGRPDFIDSDEASNAGGSDDPSGGRADDTDGESAPPSNEDGDDTNTDSGSGGGGGANSGDTSDRPESDGCSATSASGSWLGLGLLVGLIGLRRRRNA